MDNRQLIEKATIALSDITTDGGYLEPAEVRSFVQDIANEPTLLNVAETHVLDRQQKTVPHIGFSGRICFPGEMGTASTEDQKSKPTTSKVTLNTKHVKAHIEIPYDVAWFNIEQGSFVDHVRAMAKERVALDLEELFVQGDTASEDAYLALLDGWMKQATSNVYDAAGSALSKEVFKAIAKKLPSRFRKQQSVLRYVTSHNTVLEWCDLLSNRGTSLGDTALASGKPVPAYGSALLPSPSILDGLTRTIGSASVTDLTDILLTKPSNLVWGIFDQIQLEVDRNIDKGVVIIVIRAYVDATFGEEVGVAKGLNIKVS